jgi:hypothetical protein
MKMAFFWDVALCSLVDTEDVQSGHDVPEDSHLHLIEIGMIVSRCGS